MTTRDPEMEAVEDVEEAGDELVEDMMEVAMEEADTEEVATAVVEVTEEAVMEVEDTEEEDMEVVATNSAVGSVPLKYTLFFVFNSAVLKVPSSGETL